MANVKKKLCVEGMHCGSCASGIEMYLSSLDGVEDIKVSFSDKEASITYDDDKVKMEEILTGVKGLGYSATEDESA